MQNKQKKKPLKKKNKKKLPMSVPGTVDYMSDYLVLREKIKSSFKSVVSFYGFDEFEPSYIEEKSIYDKYSEANMEDIKMFYGELIPRKKISLRPSILPGIIRAYPQNKSLRVRSKKLWYFGDVFSVDTFVDKNKSRQHSQGGVVVLNTIDPAHDAQILSIMRHFANDLKFNDVTLRVNSAGCPVCRKQFAKKLKDYYKNNNVNLCNDCLASYKNDPLSIFKCNNDVCKKNRNAPPIILDSICDQCNVHFTTFLKLLDEMSVPYLVDPLLVRSQTFWSKVIFELVDGSTDKILMYGGNMNGLSKMIGGPKISMTGFNFSVDNIIENIRPAYKKNKTITQTKVVLIYVGDRAKLRIVSIMEMFYNEKIRVVESLGVVSLKKQLSVAKNAGASVAVIVGQKEVFDNTVILRNLRTGSQETVALRNIIKEVKKILSSKNK